MLAIFRVNLESFWHLETDKREGQFGVEGGIRKLKDGLGKRNAGFGIGTFIGGFNFLPDEVPSLLSNFGEFL